MQFTLTRMFAYFTLVMYLVVGSVCVRVFLPETTSINIPVSYLTFFSETKISNVEFKSVTSPELKFAEINIPVEKKPSVARRVVTAPKKASFTYEKVAKNEINFHGPVTLSPVYMQNDLPVNLASLYTEIKTEMVAEIAPVTDELTTKLASNAEPEFFSYDDEVEEKVQPEEPVQTVQSEQKEIVPNKEITQQPKNFPIEEIAIDELVAFDYSKVKEDIKSQSVSVINPVTTQNESKATRPVDEVKHQKSPKKQIPVTTQVEKQLPEMNPITKSNIEVPSVYPSRVTIQITGSDLLQEDRPEMGFEVRFQDDLNEAIQDYNSGEIVVDQDLSRPNMTRSITVLKRGYAPTNGDLILEEGVATLVLPMITEGTFNEMMAPFERRGPIGAVLVELDKDVEEAILDVPYSQVLKLNGKLQVTEESDYVYQLFVGVKAGNSLLTYRSMNGEVTSKIIHVHEREVTFDSNIFENVDKEEVQLVEQDLLGKEKTPLIISSDEVRHFASSKKSEKINDHTYRTNFNKTLLGSRKYLELTHQNEPIFVGHKYNSVLEIPSENFMRYILSRFEGSELGNRCLVQVNLKKKAVKVDIGSESVAQSLMTYTQILDSNGKFFDSIGAKSQKIIIVGENQGAAELSKDAKINIKLTYQDGTVEFLGSYCSPNSYLVEQL